MLECLIVGDQYAMDVATLNDKCYVAYTANINSEEFSNRFKKFPKANKTVISLGSFDSYITIKSLSEYRAKFGRGSTVIWVLPSKGSPNRDYVFKLATDYDDLITERPTIKEVQVAKDNFYKRENIQPKKEYSATTQDEQNNFWPPSNIETTHMDCSDDINCEDGAQNEVESYVFSSDIVWPPINIVTK